MELRAKSAFIVCVVVCASCSGGDDPAGGGGGPGDPIGIEEARPICDRYTAHEAMCHFEELPGYDWNCGDGIGAWTETAFRTFAACVTETPCSGDPTACYMSTIDAVPTRDAVLRWSERCEARWTECGMDPRLIDLRCSADGWLKLYSDAYLQMLAACFDEACDAISTCVEGL